MTRYVGVDWGGNGWICASRSADGDWTAAKHPSFLSVWHEYADATQILVDIPIGLAPEGLRRCDEAAKEELGSQRGRSVFMTPPRPVFDEPTYEEAKARMDELTGRGLSTQAWGIMPRIQELDEFFKEVPDAWGQVRESHPEVAFASLRAEGAVVESKLSADGEQVRLDTLDDVDPESSPGDEFERLVEEHITEQPAYARHFSANNKDDLLDAMGLTVTAWTADGEFTTLPEDPDDDPVREVPMEIVAADLES
ncbi:DUF429 domain-containing protein [Halorientalis brevis]|uniref:DUF429 domain-containing protein n=1 Tax=Halorientalis brevis TaxID=1126241 RepID=A0ABD6CDQ5_9EURY|nr:DUF429 domain-containing protein [Halorientalis brevis]